jgi:hypothetical protein
MAVALHTVSPLTELLQCIASRVNFTVACVLFVFLYLYWVSVACVVSCHCCCVLQPSPARLSCVDARTWLHMRRRCCRGCPSACRACSTCWASP